MDNSVFVCVVCDQITTLEDVFSALLTSRKYVEKSKAFQTMVLNTRNISKKPAAVVLVSLIMSFLCTRFHGSFCTQCLVVTVGKIELIFASL
jgi:hypothetical protein